MNITEGSLSAGHMPGYSEQCQGIGDPSALISVSQCIRDYTFSKIIVELSGTSLSEQS